MHVIFGIRGDSTVFRFVQVFRVSEAVAEERKRAGFPPPNIYITLSNAHDIW